ncbi:syntaxin-8-like, partial [Plakobranchus ocellatus]
MTRKSFLHTLQPDSLSPGEPRPPRLFLNLLSARLSFLNMNLFLYGNRSCHKLSAKVICHAQSFAVTFSSVFTMAGDSWLSDYDFCSNMGQDIMEKINERDKHARTSSAYTK